MKKFFLASALLLVCSVFLTAFLNSSPEELESPPDCMQAIPVAISPNGDGINDRFELQAECELASFELQIYDQENHLIFASHDPHQSWEGTSAPEGYYRWVIAYQANQSASPIQQTGELALVR